MLLYLFLFEYSCFISRFSIKRWQQRHKAIMNFTFLPYYFYMLFITVHHIQPSQNFSSSSTRKHLTPHFYVSTLSCTIFFLFFFFSTFSFFTQHKQKLYKQLSRCFSILRLSMWASGTGREEMTAKKDEFMLWTKMKVVN